MGLRRYFNVGIQFFRTFLNVYGMHWKKCSSVGSMYSKVCLNALTNVVVKLVGALISVCSVPVVIVGRYVVDLETAVVDVVGVGAVVDVEKYAEL